MWNCCLSPMHRVCAHLPVVMTRECVTTIPYGPKTEHRKTEELSE